MTVKTGNVASAAIPTPRTDAAVKNAPDEFDAVPVEFARTLERELAAAKLSISDAVTSERARCEACVPNTWLDSLLTGPNAVVGEPPYHAPDIEKLFIAVRKRMEPPK